MTLFSSFQHLIRLILIIYILQSLHATTGTGTSQATAAANTTSSSSHFEHPSTLPSFPSSPPSPQHHEYANTSTGDGLLYVVTTVFYPIAASESHSSEAADHLALYHEFARRLHQTHSSTANVRLVTIECIFPSLGQTEFYATRPNEPLEFQLVYPNPPVETEFPLPWLKEGLLNYAIQRLPPEAQLIAWIDTDVEFHSNQWASMAIDALNNYAAVQLFQVAHGPGEFGHSTEAAASPDRTLAANILSPSYAYSLNYFYDMGPLPPLSFGRAWAMRRSVFHAMGGLPDVHLVGIGAREFARSITRSLTETDYKIAPSNSAYIDCRLRKQGQIRHALIEARAKYQLRGGLLGFIRVNITHQSSSHYDDPNHESIRRILKAQFNPQLDLTGFDAENECPGRADRMGLVLRQIQVQSKAGPDGPVHVRGATIGKQTPESRQALVRFVRMKQLKQDLTQYARTKFQIQPREQATQDAPLQTNEGTNAISTPTTNVTIHSGREICDGSASSENNSDLCTASDESILNAPKKIDPSPHVPSSSPSHHQQVLSAPIRHRDGRDPSQTPNGSLTLLVFSADENFFPLLKGLVLSLLRDQVLTSTMQLALIDIGCSAQSREWLLERGIWIREVDPLIMGDLADKRFGYQLAQMSRPFLPQLFPQGQYFIWLDTDIWVQDPTVPLMLEAEMASNDFGERVIVAPEVHFSYTTMADPATRFTELFVSYQLLYTIETATRLATLPVLNSGLFAMRAESHVWAEWAEELQRIMITGRSSPGIDHPEPISFLTPLAPWLRAPGSDRLILRVAHMADQLVLNMILRRHESSRLRLLDPLYNFICLWASPIRGYEGQQAARNQPDGSATAVGDVSPPVRLRQLPYSVIGVIHLAAWHYFGPMYIKSGLLYDEGRYLTPDDWTILDRTHSRPMPR